MHNTQKNPPITSLLRGITFIEVLVLIWAGGLLFFLPQTARDNWAWVLTPFNTRFLGAIYLSAMTSIAAMTFWGRWSPARIVLWAIFIFTLIVLVVSLLYTDQFDFDKWGTWWWFVLYIALPASSGYHLWLYRHQPAVDPLKVPLLWRNILLILAVGVGLYGISMIVIPKDASSLFSWALDEFHTRLYSSTFISGAVMLALIARGASALEWMVAGVLEITLAVFAIAGLYLVDADVNRIDWDATKTYLWLIFFAVSFVMGVAMLVQGSRQRK